LLAAERVRQASTWEETSELMRTQTFPLLVEIKNVKNQEPEEVRK
jgi:hypothetical protein